MVFTRINLTLCFAMLVVAHANAQSDSTPGISNSKPESGYFVKFRDVYLVSYSFQIPGTRTSIDMVPVPAGNYLLKFKDKSGKANSILVKVAPFWMAKTETTWEQYQPFMALDKSFRQFQRLKIRQVAKKNMADAISAPSAIYDRDFRMKNCGGENTHPAATMSQFAAKCFTKYLTRLTGTSYRLPSAVEWRYAAAAANQPHERKNFSNAELLEMAWFEDNAAQRNLVGKKKPNRWGIHDLLGNVSEWVLDGKTYDNGLLKGMTISSIDAVAWPTKRHGRLALGGSFFDLPEDCQVDSQKVSSNELWDFDPMLPISPHWTASDDSQGFGFRIVRPFNSKIPEALAKRYWEPDHKDLRDDIRSSIESRGSILTGVVDPELPKAIEKLATEELDKRKKR